MNPIREFLDDNELRYSGAHRDDVEQWADLVDQLQNPWVDANKRLPDDEGWYIGWNERDGAWEKVYFSGLVFRVPYLPIQIELDYWAFLPAPPSKGGE